MAFQTRETSVSKIIGDLKKVKLSVFVKKLSVLYNFALRCVPNSRLVAHIRLYTSARCGAVPVGRALTGQACALCSAPAAAHPFPQSCPPLPTHPTIVQSASPFSQSRSAAPRARLLSVRTVCGRKQTADIGVSIGENYNFVK